MSPDFNFNGRRLALALAFQEARTAREAARSIGVETGSVFGLIQRMNAESILRTVGQGKPTRGTEYVLTEDGSHALALELERRRDPGEETAGTVVEGQEVIMVRGGRVSEVQAIFADPALSLTIAWAATLGADWLLSLTADADKFAIRKLIFALEKVGCACEHGTVSSTLSGRRLREQAADLVGDEVVG